MHYQTGLRSIRKTYKLTVSDARLLHGRIAYGLLERVA